MALIGKMLENCYRNNCYTNHTVLSEALERWPVEYVQKLLPRIYMIIEEINRRHIQAVSRETGNMHIAQDTAIKEGQVHMANLAIIGSFSVNGVAYLHTEILKADVFNEFYSLYPGRFNNKTNGITHRRWLVYSNPELTQMLIDTIGDDFIYDPIQLEKLLESH